MKCQQTLIKTITKTFILALFSALITLFLCLFFSQKPSLLTGMNFSKAFFDNKQHLLRLTLSADDKYRIFTPLAEIPPNIIETTLLQEDQYFYNHLGINPLALIKALGNTYFLKSRRVGASTISMQVARMHFNINSKKISGKLLQMYRSLQLERHYSKNQILEAYLNLAPYGGNIEGVGAASLIYFNTPINKLTLPQALTLAVIPQNPTKRKPPSPFLTKSRHLLFERWLHLHPEDKSFIPAINLPLITRNTQHLPFKAPHLVNTLLNTRDNNIHTTIDDQLQTLVERIVKQYMLRKQALDVRNAAVLLVDTRDMGIKSYLGSANFFNAAIQGQINGIETKRSPGSTLKPFIYALALDQGLIHPLTVLKDVPHSFGSYNPENFDNDFMGPITAQDALVLSRNIPAIYLANQLKPKNLYSFLEEAHVSHLKSERFYGLALTLGGAELSIRELSSLYAILANQGIWHPLRTREKDPIHIGKRLLSPEASYLVLDMLQNTTRPENSQVSIPVYWKTGTSSGYRDAWSVGVFGPYVLTVWIGNFNNSSNPAFIGKNIAAPLFFDLIAAIKQEKKQIPPLHIDVKNLNIVQVEVCKASGRLPTPFCKDRSNAGFIPGVSPIKTDTIFREIAINRKSGLRTCHIDENTQFAVYEFWPSDLLKILNKAGIKPKTPPFFEEGCVVKSNNGPSPQISSPKKDITYIVRIDDPSNSKIPFTAVTDAGISTLYWFINDHFFSKSSIDKPLFWQAKAGRHIVRVVDERGLSDVRAIHVQMEK